MDHQGRAGQHGQWPISDYRRLLAAIRIRETGIKDVSTIRLRLRFSGIPMDIAEVPADLAAAFRRIVRQARRELPIPPPGRLREKAPLRLRKEVAQTVEQFQSGALSLPPGCAGEWLEALRGNADLTRILVAVVDLIYTGPEAPVLQRLREVGALLPASMLSAPGEIVDATAFSAGSFAPADGTNLVVAALDDATPEDVLLADEFMRWFPRFLLWTMEVIDQIEPTLALPVKQLCAFVLKQLPRLPLEGRVFAHAMLTACYVRFRKGEVNWAPGLAFAENADPAA